MKVNLKSILAGIMSVCMLAAATACGEKKSIDDMTEKDIENAFNELDKQNKKDSGKKSEESKVQKIDPFENLKVSFTGTFPESKVTYTGGNSCAVYIPDVTNGVKNGDVVTIKAEFDDPYYEEQYEFTETTKEYTVDGLSAYAMTLDEIPEDMKTKMIKQADDSILAYTAGWREGNSLNSSEMIGYYFLTSKDGMPQSPYNELYLVYKMSVNVTGLKRHGDGQTQETGTEEYYTFYRYSDIVFLPDGTCSVDLSKGSLTSNTIESDYGYYDLIAIFYNYKGYNDLDSMFNECVTKKIDRYNYESTVK